MDHSIFGSMSGADHFVLDSRPNPKPASRSNPEPACSLPVGRALTVRQS